MMQEREGRFLRSTFCNSLVKVESSAQWKGLALDRLTGEKIKNTWAQELGKWRWWWEFEEFHFSSTHFLLKHSSQAFNSSSTISVKFLPKPSVTSMLLNQVLILLTQQHLTGLLSLLENTSLPENHCLLSFFYQFLLSPK